MTDQSKPPPGIHLTSLAAVRAYRDAIAREVIEECIRRVEATFTGPTSHPDPAAAPLRRMLEEMDG